LEKTLLLKGGAVDGIPDKQTSISVVVKAGGNFVSEKYGN
jgi:hypothetical protein